VLAVQVCEPSMQDSQVHTSAVAHCYDLTPTSLTLAHCTQHKATLQHELEVSKSPQSPMDTLYGNLQLKHDFSYPSNDPLIGETVTLIAMI
jgi:hypothetical protein